MEFRLPELGEGVYEAEMGDWLVKAGETVKRGQSLMEVVTDKAIVEVPAPFAGTVTALQAEPGTQIKVGDVVLSYTTAEQPEAETQEPGERKEADTKEEAPPRARADAAMQTRGDGGLQRRRDAAAGAVQAAPSVRRMARALGVNLAQVRGSGPGGRILIDDLSAHVKPAAGEEKLPAAARPPVYGTAGTRVKFHGVRRKIAEQMVLSKRTIPHYAYVDECDATELVRLRESLREVSVRVGVKLTYLPFFVKAAVAALQEVPIVNASLDEEAEEIVLHDRYHIGIATATPQGLLVPVVRDADRKDVLRIARDIERLSSEAAAGKARREDLRGSTFTITSIGGIGGLISTPVINYPEVAILGIGKVVKRPVYDAAGNLHPADLVYLSFSFDHRVVDGAVGAAFGNALIRRLQKPGALLLPELD